LIGGGTMFCPNCANTLEAVDKILSQDLQGGDYYTHFCSNCKTYWHLHIHGESVDLISTTGQFIASKKIVDDLKIELGERLLKLEK